MSLQVSVGVTTFLFTDIAGSSQLWEQYPEGMKQALARHDAFLRSSVEANQGQIIKTTGDGCYATFESALCAVNAALAAQQTFGANAWSEINPQVLRVRMALHTGEAETRDGDYFGPALNRTARLMSAGHGGQVLLSASTAELVRDSLPEGVILVDLGEHRLKDLTRPERVYQLTAPGLNGQFPPLLSLDAYPNNLPAQLTSFIGREKEMAEVKQMLARSRLVTLTGPGGTGKTRLSLQVAAELLTVYPDGAWLVELSALTDPDLLMQTLAAVFGLHEIPGRCIADLVMDYLRARRLLLLLDNCEHLIDACAHLADQLLRACPGIQIVASSREALGIAGEVAYRVPSLAVPSLAMPSLSVPNPDRLALESLAKYEAVQLFVERAVAAHSGFRLNERNAPAIVQICQRLDGIPLALELAAARAKVFTPEQIALHLDDRFRLLTGGSRTALPRQQTLRALIDWSYDLLSEPERCLLQRLSVFVGGWSFESAEAVSFDLDVLELLPQLVNKSLVIVDDHAAQTRYRQLETIRQYARDRLFESGEGATARDRHLDYFLNLSEQAQPELRGECAFDWFDRLEPDYDNFLAALEWGLETRPEDALAMAGNLLFAWSFRIDRREGLHLVSELLHRVDSLPAVQGIRALRRASIKAKGLVLAGLFTMGQGINDAADELIQQAIAIERTLNDPFILAFALGMHATVSRFLANGLESSLAAADESEKLLNSVGAYQWRVMSLYLRIMIATYRGDWVAHQRYHDQARRMIHAVYHPYLTSALLGLGLDARYTGLYELAQLYFEEGIKNARRLKSRSFEMALRSEQVHVLRQMGRWSEAMQGYRQMIVEWKAVGHRAAVANQLECMAFIARATGDLAFAARLFGAAEALREFIQVAMAEFERPEYEQEVAALRSQMDPELFAPAWADGRAITMDQAIAFALQQAEPAPT